jgi:farnesyl diphosphate synthase
MSSVTTPASHGELDRRLAQNAEAIETLLAALLASEPAEGEIARPPRLVAAMRHGALGGG